MNRPAPQSLAPRDPLDYRLATVVISPSRATRYSGCPSCHTRNCTRCPGEYCAIKSLNVLPSGIVLPSNSLITSPGLIPALSAGDPINTARTFAPQTSGAYAVVTPKYAGPLAGSTSGCRKCTLATPFTLCTICAILRASFRL